MKKVMVLFLFLSSFLLVHAQYESFFGGDSWEYSEGFQPITKNTADYDPYLLGCLTNTYSFTRSDTVVIGGQKYYDCVTNGLGEYQVKLREDTQNGRLYALIENKEFLLCDMSLSIGDTFKLPVSQLYNYVDTMRMVVDSVTFVNSKKVLHLSPVSAADQGWWYPLTVGHYYNISLRFMEGVGPTYGIVPPHGQGDVLLCLTKDDTLYYMTHPDLGCWQEYVAVPDYSDLYITLYPNPSDQQLFLRFSTEENVRGVVYVRDNLGRVCLRRNVVEPMTILNLYSLSPGIYLLTFIDQQNRIITKKFIKQ